ncbi:MAG: DUF4062 domain-containing protein [Planctomycetota bacterium]|nr:DUF4062 domain-containing protein [Planctomycetota bacterium]
MSKPRTFISSTFYDLADVRARLFAFLEEIGHEPLLHETPGFGVTPGAHSHVACLDQVDNADYLVLIIGGRRGGTHVATEKSITSEEYRRAVLRKIPIIIFVKKDVDVAWALYKENPSGDFSRIVDDVRIFDFIDLVRSQSEDNWIRRFETAEDMVQELRGQFAYIHLLFSQRLVRERQPSSKKKEAGEKYVIKNFPSDFSKLTEKMENEVAAAVVAGLRLVHGTLKTMQSRRVQGYEEKCKVLWLLGRYGKLGESGSSLYMSADSFKQYAWGTSRGTRVFNQLNDFGVEGRYSHDDTTGDTDVILSLHGESATWALQVYVRDLLKKYGEDDGIELFQRAEMRIWSR